MVKIKEIKIVRFRSINEIVLKIDDNCNIASICGQNNVGKTNVLRAIDLFFNPNKYDYKLDVPHFKQANEYGGGSVYTTITITFFDIDTNSIYCFTRDFKKWIDGKPDLVKCYKKAGNIKTDLSEKDVIKFFSKIKVYFVESVDSILYDTINDVADDVLEIKYKNARFSDSRKKLKQYYDEYIDGMQEILNEFSTQISNTFTSFNKNWSIDFNVPKQSSTFQELITRDVVFNLYDKGASGIVNKGAGLQRLAAILLQFEVIKRNKKTQAIILIDEPDLYIHEGLQKKLYEFINSVSKTNQILYTTHSPVFVDTYKMRNVFLIELKPEVRNVKGKENTVYLSTLVDLNKDNGYEKICEHLGIERDIAEPLHQFNILCEGESDVRYFSQLAKYFGCKEVNFISANGVTAIPKWLQFYNAFYKDIPDKKPIVKVVFDNDSEGRETYKKVKPNQYSNIIVQKILLNNYLGDANINEQQNNTNNEVEDFVYPEIMCYLVNQLLKKKSMNLINEKEVVKKIKAPAFKNYGILSLIENEKNNANPDRGQEVTFALSNLATENIKKSLSDMFKIQLNSKLIRVLNDCRIKYPFVESMIKELFNFTATASN